MKKETEIIAKNNYKKFFIFVLIAVLVSLPTSFYFLKSPDFRWLGIFFTSCIIFTIILSLLMLIILPSNAIVKEGENIILSLGVFKEVVPIKRITSVEVLPLKNLEIMSKHGNIIIKAKDLNEQGKTFTVNVKDKAEVVERVNALINQ